MSTLPKDIQRRMEKLLAMANSQCNEHEAALATEKLHKLLVEYNYSRSKLERNLSQADIGITEIVAPKRPWVWDSITAISALNFCDDYRTGHWERSVATYSIVGTDTNRLVAVPLIEAVLGVVKREAALGSRVRHGCRNSGYITSFCNGASVRIVQRCNEMKTSAEQGRMQGTDGSLLPALRNLYAQYQASNAAYIFELEGALDSAQTKPRRSTDYVGYYDGDAAGARVNLTKNIAAGSEVDAPVLLGVAS